MNKTSFINYELLTRLAFWTVVVVLGWQTIEAWLAEDHLGVVIYFVLLLMLTITDSLHRIWKMVKEVKNANAVVMSFVPHFGKAIDFMGERSVETNRFVMHKLLSDEEKAKMIDITQEVYGEESAAKLEKYLLIGPLESIMNDRDEKLAEQVAREDSPE